MRFAEPLAFLALLLAPLVLLAHWLNERRLERQLGATGDLGLLTEMMALGDDRGRTIRLAKAALFAGAMALVAVALARPQFGMRTETRKGRAMDLVVALDLSKSMLARDVVPSRLERSRVEIGALIERMKGDRIGFVGFTSAAVPMCPLTVDHAALKLQLQAASPGELPRGGTAIGEAIKTAQHMLDSTKDKSGGKAILIITDGEEHEGDPEAAAKEAKAAGIEVHVAGVGSRTGEPIPILDGSGNATGYLKDRNGQTVVSRLNEAMLKSIAAAGGGIAALPGPSGGIDLEPVRAHLGRLKKVELEERTVRIYEERYRWALAPAFGLLLLASAIRPGRRRAAVRIRVAGLAAASLLLLGAGPFERDDPDVKEGNRLLADGHAKEALAAYDRAKARLGENAPVLALDRGLAQAAAGELDAATKDLETALAGSDDAAVRAQAAFALGNAQRSLKKYDEAIRSYRRALVEDPKNAGARRNLELAAAMKRIEALQPKKPGDDKQQQNDKDKPPQTDGGPQDGGGQDAGGEDSGGNGADGGGDQQGQDAGASDSGGSGEQKGQDGGGGGKDASSASNSQDASGQGQDAGSAGQAQKQPPKDQKDLNQQKPEQILDALQQEEKAVKQKKLLQQFEGKTVEKDW